MPNRIKMALQMGIACSMVAFGYALSMHKGINDAPLAASIVSVCGTMLTGSIIWYYLIEKASKRTVMRGVLVGLITGWLSLYLGLAGGFGYEVLKGTSPLWDRIMSVLQLVAYVPALTIPLIFLYGWLNILLCCLAGAILVVRNQ